ncbi:protein kinase [Micromonospora yasonensis]|uniref:protein kinase domain-containing protein n=1 Tax=Micromonospora yasonensis TaxID=1128667 RepID=UPI00222E72C0|nr:protein kinase [Micromonospora yasonensis]MCW3842860.1 protein kinase [Micromonospora yasonensis]
MARLTVMGDYQGPGERKTTETLARDLPDSWEVIAGRKLSGPRRDDVDLVVVGDRAIFLLDEKAWGPEITLSDQYWLVRGEERRNPLDRVNQLARALAGQLRDHVHGYRTAVGGRRLVVAGVVLSHDHLTLQYDGTYADGDVVQPLSEAAAWLQREDAKFGTDLFSARTDVIDFLVGLPGRDSLPARIGPYQIVQELAAIGVARCFHARDGRRTVILRCYPMHGWGLDGSPTQLIERERVALDRLEERDRTWQIHPSFEYEARQWIVVPVVPARGRSLASSIPLNDPPRTEGRLAQQIQVDVVEDAFRGLAEVHAAGLLHRGLCPSRVFLGRGLRAKFSDFYLARVAGEHTIAPDVSADADTGVPYRAPECRDGIGYASTVSDVYSLALTLAVWILGKIPTEPDAELVRGDIAETAVVGSILAECLDPDPRCRPESAAVVARIEQATAGVPAPEPSGSVTSGSEFRVGGVVAGRYEILESLGRGGFARTWRARDKFTDANRVIKQFHDDLSAEYARREFAAADRVRHDYCARVYDLSTEKPGYLVLEYVPGQNLKDFAANNPPEVERYRSIALDVLSALSYLHRHDLVHRDITPTNIIATAQYGGKLIDFGVAGPAQNTTIVGTPPFMAPELRAGRGATARSDIYGLAVTMIYTMLGRYPYAGDPACGTDDRSELLHPTREERDSWGAFGSAVLDVFFKGAHADPTQRPTSVDEWARQLRLLDDLPARVGVVAVNPVIDQLRGLYRASAVGNSGNRGLDDEFARSTYVPTLLDSKLQPAVIRGQTRLVLLTGNPGDGKTSFLVQVGEELTRRGAEIVEKTAAGWRMRLNGHSYVSIYDASESHEGKSSDDLMREALDPADGEDPQRRTVLLAINDGRLLQFFDEYDHLYPDEAREIRNQMAGRPASDDSIVLVDLKRRTLASRPDGQSLAGRILDTFTEPQLWSVCDTCVSHAVCPMLRNATELRETARDTVEELIATSHLRRHRRATFRDVRSALAWLITGDRSCEQVHQARERGMDLRRADDTLVEDLAFDRRCADYLIQEWADLDPAATAAPNVERAARGDRDLVPDPTAFTDRDRQRAQRLLYFGLWSPDRLGRSVVRAYRYFDVFRAALLGSSDASLEEMRARLLLGLSRLLGAPGYQGSDLAVADQGAGGTWAVLKEISAAEFTLEQVTRPLAYVEWCPDALQLRHHDGPSLTLTLDTIELILRVADGDLIGDSATESVRQEIETFAIGLRHSPASAVRIVDPAGSPRRVTVVDRRIRLEQA